MRLVIISDTHGQHKKLDMPDGDVLIHCGDYSTHGHPEDTKAFLEWFYTQPHKHRVFISGNHDGLSYRLPIMFHNMLIDVEEKAGCALSQTYLECSSIEIEGVKFYGSPWTPTFNTWAWMLDRRSDDMITQISNIPTDVDVLITHGPTKGILDLTMDGRTEGCEVLSARMHDLKNLKLHAFGHIHEGAGVADIEGVRHVNAAMLNHKYQMINDPWVIDI